MEAIPAMFSSIGTALGEVGTAIGPTLTQIANFANPLGSILGAVNSGVGLVENIMNGPGGGQSAPAVPAAAAPTSTQSSVSPTDFKNNESAYWNQLLAGTGISPTGQLPDSIQQNIDRQASLLG